MGECSVSRLGRFTTMKIVPSTHGIGRWLGPTASLERNNCPSLKPEDAASKRCSLCGSYREKPYGQLWPSFTDRIFCNRG